MHFRPPRLSVVDEPKNGNCADPVCCQCARDGWIMDGAAVVIEAGEGAFEEAGPIFGGGRFMRKIETGPHWAGTGLSGRLGAGRWGLQRALQRAQRGRFICVRDRTIRHLPRPPSAPCLPGQAYLLTPVEPTRGCLQTYFGGVFPRTGRRRKSTLLPAPKGSDDVLD